MSEADTLKATADPARLQPSTQLRCEQSCFTDLRYADFNKSLYRPDIYRTYVRAQQDRQITGGYKSPPYKRRKEMYATEAAQSKPKKKKGKGTNASQPNGNKPSDAAQPKSKKKRKGKKSKGKVGTNPAQPNGKDSTDAIQPKGKKVWWRRQKSKSINAAEAVQSDANIRGMANVTQPNQKSGSQE